MISHDRNNGYACFSIYQVSSQSHRYTSTQYLSQMTIILLVKAGHLNSIHV